MSFLFGECCGAGGRLVWTAPPAFGWAVVLALLAGLALAGRLEARRRVPELLALALALVPVGLAAFGPTWIQEGERYERGRFVVLVDASRSMSIGAEATTRAEVSAILARLPEAEVHHFGDTLRPGEPAAYDLDGTDVAGALAAVTARYAGERLEGVALVTDGLDRGGLRRRLAVDGAAAVPRLNGPLTVYQVRRDDEAPDVAVTDIRGGGFAFLRSPFRLDVDVVARNRPAEPVTVHLTRDGQPVASRRVEIDAEGRGTARFDVTPDLVGRAIWEAAVDVAPDDVVPANNALTLAVRVVRDRLRVLQVCGAPSWDQKFLRLFLKEDPGIDLVSFFILRTPQDFGSGYRGDELALIEFPYERLFADDLGTFDLVILQNFNWEPYFDHSARELLQNLEEYVREGHALAMIGGDRSFDLGNWGETPVAGVLPVRLGVTGEPIDASPFSPTLTEAGQRHPITALAAEAAENARAWGQLSELDGVNLSLGAAPGAAVLLAHPTLKGADGAPLPVLAAQSFGAGRTMALMGDSSWRWSFSEAGEGRGNQAYLRFWKNALRWLVGDPEDRPVVVESARDNFQLGEAVELMVRARDVGFGAAAGATVTATVSGPGGQTELAGVTGADGSVVLVAPSAVRGAHRVKIRAVAADGEVLGDAVTVYAVVTRDPELEEIAPDGNFLRSLAAAVGGRYVAPGLVAEPLRDESAGRRVVDREETALYALPALPLVFSVLASLSWWLRRRSGLR